MSRMSTISKAGLAAVTLTLVAGCTERPPRSFVQPNVLKKSDLVGASGDAKWYYIQTITEAPVTSSFTFIGNSSELMKVKFDIQEGFLFARRAYEQIEGSEDAYVQDPAKYAGQVLAAWPITKQFDIIRDYNATTGEETNKIIESEERSWNEREFIRVNWAKDEAPTQDPGGIYANFIFEPGVKLTSASYWESDPTKPDAIHLERASQEDADRDGEFVLGEANYLDITNKWVITPEEKTINFEEKGVWQSITYPACYFRNMFDDCATQIVKVRHGFAKISPSHDYQPRRWDGKQMDLFGIWDVGLNRLTYNRQYGVTNTGVKRHAARFNLWKKSYQADGRTPIPYQQREQRTIPYYLSSTLEPFPPELWEEAAKVVRAWNDATKVAVQDVTGRLNVADVFVPCHNPVKVGEDPQVCSAGLKPQLDADGKPLLKDGQPILRARQGDPRRSHIFWVNQQQYSGPLGYGPPLFDIETGETISGQAYVYGANVDSYAARSRDLVMLLLGRQSPEEFIAGVNVKDWVASNRAGTQNLSKTHSYEDRLARASAMDFSWARGQAPQSPIDASSLKSFVTSLRDREDAMYKGGIWGSSNAALGQITRDRLKGTKLEAMMITPDVMAMADARPGTDWTSLSPAEKGRVSPLRSQAVARMIDERMDKMRALGYDFAEFADEGIAQRAIHLANDPEVPNMDPEAIRQKLRKEIYFGVQLHEMGHNVGLRHNFRASYDAMNYYPEYWRMRDAAAKNLGGKRFGGVSATGQPISVNYTGADCNGPKLGKMRPRFVDCPGGATSVEEAVGRSFEYQYSSIMDYGSEFNSDFQGLGKYDKAAMKFSYAGDGYVEVFTQARRDEASQLKWASIIAFQGSFGFPSAISLGTTLEAINYTSYPSLFTTGIAGMEARQDVPYSDIQEGGPGGYLRQDSEGNPLVPYFFCSDEFAGNLTCMRFDAGADAYEQAVDVISRYDNFYLLNNFKRDRYNFRTSLAYKSRIVDRYLNPLRTQMTWLTLLRGSLADFFGPGTDPFYASEDGWGDFSLGVSLGFDALGRILTKPEAGSYSFVGATDSPDYPLGYYRQSSDSLTGGPGQIVLGLLEGKFATTTWDFDECGYYWGDECQSRIGYFIDKTLALEVLADSQAYFTGRDTSVDVRKYAIGYVVPYRKQIEEKIGALLAGDYVSYAPRLDQSSPLTPRATQVNWSLNAVPPDAGNILDPASGFTLQLYAGMYGLSEFPTTFERSFIDKTRIFVVGNGEAPVSDSTMSCSTAGVGGGNGYYCITDAETGKSYAAKMYPAGTAVDRVDVGVRMLQNYGAILAQRDAVCAGAGATTPQCAAKRVAGEQFRQNLDVMRSLHHAFGYGTYHSDAPFIY